MIESIQLVTKNLYAYYSGIINECQIYYESMTLIDDMLGVKRTKKEQIRIIKYAWAFAIMNKIVREALPYINVKEESHG